MPRLNINTLTEELNRESELTLRPKKVNISRETPKDAPVEKNWKRVRRTKWMTDCLG
jgi:hypothetical protein